LVARKVAMPASLYAQVIVDIPTRALDSAFDYEVPVELREAAQVGCCVLVDFAHRPSLGSIIGLRETLKNPETANKIKPLKEVLSAPYFDAVSAELAQWISREYLAPLSETIHLFTPPGSAPRLKKDESGIWQLEHPGIGPVDDRWVSLTEDGRSFEPKANAVKQRAIIEALRIGEVRVAELSLEISQVATSLKALEKREIVHIEARRRLRGQRPPLPPTQDISNLTDGQRGALEVILDSLSPKCVSQEKRVTEGDSGRDALPPVILLDGVTGSGKTEVYLQTIRSVLEQGGSAVVLVPEISLTPQTVARFRARFGEQVAVLHSRLSAGERLDQWDFVRSGVARVVVGARSALFAPMQDLRLIIIDEEHESSYKQSSSPRYVTRDVAAKMAQLRGATLVLGTATPSMEALYAVQTGAYTAVQLPERASGKPLPSIQVVDLSAEFHAGNKTMFSQPLQKALFETIERKEKAVLLLNKRGFASFLLCRDCGYVPMCENCATSLTYHERPARLMCHHCGATRPVPTKCPECGSPYLKQLGPGTQFAFDQLKTLLPEGTPIVRMDADTTRGKHGHERCLDEFIAAPTGVLLGTQMIAKGLDFPEVTLVGVLIADTSLNFPDLRAPEHTFQLLEQVAGRAGRAKKDGRVIVQTYWPEHVAIRAAAAHDRELLLTDERAVRSELGYPPYSRLANILLWGKDLKAVTAEAMKLANQLDDVLSVVPDASSVILNAVKNRAQESAPCYQLLGPSPCVLAKRQGNHRWHILIKAPAGSGLPDLLAPLFKDRKASPGVNVAIDIDPVDLL
jgi:primosomal protein N' (replication factor Y)